MSHYKEVYEEFWKDIIEDDEGNIDKDALMRELCDYAFLLEVYLEITGGKISYPNTYAYEVIGEANKHYDEIYDDVLKEMDLIEFDFPFENSNLDD